MKNDEGWLTTTEACARYLIEASTFLDWQRYRGFPLDAKRRRSPGSPVEWHVPSIDEWLRDRPRSPRQRPSRWWSVVNVQGYPDKRRKGAR